MSGQQFGKQKLQNCTEIWFYERGCNLYELDIFTKTPGLQSRARILPKRISRINHPQKQLITSRVHGSSGVFLDHSFA
jgi:hypothetical protein